MKRFIYPKPSSNLTVIKTDSEQDEHFFYKGHPEFLIPDFDADIQDIFSSFLDYLEANYCKGKELYNQNGGEIVFHQVIDTSTGLTSCKYTAYGIQLTNRSKPIDIEVYIVGYVILDNADTYFHAVEVTEKI
jgi:hypothetical protein